MGPGRHGGGEKHYEADGMDGKIVYRGRMPSEKLGKMRQVLPGHKFQPGFRGFPDRGGGLCIEITVSIG